MPKHAGCNLVEIWRALHSWADSVLFARFMPENPRAKRSPAMTLVIVLVLGAVTFGFYKFGKPETNVRIYEPAPPANQTSILAQAKRDLSAKMEPVKRALMGDRQISVAMLIVNLEELGRQSVPGDFGWIGTPAKTDTNGTSVWVLGPDQRDVFDRGLQGLKNARAISSPRVIVLEGGEARVEMTESKFIRLPGGLVTNMDFGTTMEVRPESGGTDYIKLTAIPKFTEFLGYDSSGETSAPLIKETKTAVTALLASGDTMVIGGRIPAELNVGTRSVKTNSASLMIVLQPRFVDAIVSSLPAPVGTKSQGK